MRARSSSPSVFSVPDSESESDFTPSSPPARQQRSVPLKRKSVKAGPSSSKRTAKTRHTISVKAESLVDLEDLSDVLAVNRTHGEGYHDVGAIAEAQEGLLAWFEDVREKRGMPWRKPYDPSMSMEEKGQRAYEIWVSEVMLQQTQVATVIAYWQRWIEKWPTIADLAKADIEEVNAMWRGLGYYRRARSLLAGAKTVMSHKKYHGRLPDSPTILEKEIDGVGRYTAGAICSMAYGVRVPIVDGNVHRLFTRLLALHAPQTAPSTVKFLWAAAEDLVGRLPVDDAREGIAGDWNQALMELGSQICKPVSPECASCPVRPACKAYAELATASSVLADEAVCGLCVPIPTPIQTNRIPSVTVFPVKKDKKVSREEEESVVVLEWRGRDDTRQWLWIKRPEKGLLAGLYEPPTTPVPSSSSPQECLDISLAAVTDYADLSTIPAGARQHRYVSSIPHIFSHINMTYHIHHIILDDPSSTHPPALLPDTPRQAVWLDEAGVEHANIGTGVKKVWAEVYGAWGSFEVTSERPTKKAKPSKPVGGKKRPAKTMPLEEVVNGKVVKKIMMPLMPVKEG
ncbi:A/G-specific adenine glycosylase [Kwoniella sp. DSM 27419]